MKKKFWLIGILGLLIGLALSGLIFQMIRRQALENVPEGSLKYYRLSSVMEEQNNAFSVYDLGIAATDSELMVVTQPEALFNDPAISRLDFQLTNKDQSLFTAYFSNWNAESKPEAAHDLISYKPTRLKVAVSELKNLTVKVTVYRLKDKVSDEYATSYPQQQSSEDDYSEDVDTENDDGLTNHFTYQVTLKSYFNTQNNQDF